jgi:RimJ/RimL family protein N-acetyltransferase
MKHISRRPVLRAEWPLVREWRNEASVFGYMGTNRNLSLEEHMTWFDNRLKNVESYPLFGYYIENQLIATTRIDPYEKHSYEISIIVSPNHRKEGVAFFCLKDTLDYLVADAKYSETSIFATIHPSNVASFKLFTKLGFSQVKLNDNGFSVLRKSN